MFHIRFNNLKEIGFHVHNANKKDKIYTIDIIPYQWLNLMILGNLL